MNLSVASVTQRIRFIGETITGTLNYTCGEAPLHPIGALGAVDLVFFKWVQQLLGLRNHSSTVANGTLLVFLENISAKLCPLGRSDTSAGWP